MADVKRLIAQNPRCLLSRRQLRSLFSDVYMNDAASVNVLLTAYDIGIVDHMRARFPLDDFEKARLKRVLVTQYSIMDDRAGWAVDAWTSFFDANIAQALLRIEADEKAAREATARAEAEILAIAQEQQTIPEEPQYDFQSRIDIENYYVNPSLDENNRRIYVPCGLGVMDNGFFIYGIKKSLLCEHPQANVYALVYNLLIRNSKMTEDDIPPYIHRIESLYEIDYRVVFRIAILVLQMIKNNYMRGAMLEVCFQGDSDSFKYAVGLINHYAERFSRLMKVQFVRLRVHNSPKGQPISLDGNTGIYVRDNTEFVSNAREMWYGRKINYRLTRADLPDMESLLADISPFDSFKEGQYDALCSMLAAKRHSVCIMPTGSGKSLIYYMVSILQPLPIFVVAPTDILIQDQIRNLRTIHRIDNIAHMQLTSDNRFENFLPHNSLNYLTPMTLQNRHLLVSFRYINSGTKLINMHAERIAPGALVSYVVLDEIHCLSNWGHDFRPEYLMLSKYLNKFFDQISFLGFTATANYTVVEDIQRQLGIQQENFISPISFEKNNISYDYRCVSSSDEMLHTTAEIVGQLVARNERTIIFTKSDAVSDALADAVGYEADVFSSKNPDAYHHFVDGKCKVLITSQDLGIGINFPDIRNIIHYGLPLSKSEYVQEIGRAGRASEQVKSYVVYLANDVHLIPSKLLDRSTAIDEIPYLLKGVSNDYVDIYRKITNYCPTKDTLYNRLIAQYRTLSDDNKAAYLVSYPLDQLEQAKQLLYMLFVVGYVNDWYTYGRSKEIDGVDIFIDIKSTDTRAYENPKKMIARMKERLRNYFEDMDNNRESIAKTSRAETPEEMISVFVDWYYRKYLYHHNEQFLDLYDFITQNTDGADEQITESIRDYFILPFIKLKSDEALYNDLSMRDIINKVVVGINKASVANIERINSNRYSIKLDLLLFCANLRYHNQFEASRLRRVMGNATKAEKQEIAAAFAKLYRVCETKGRLAILNYIERNGAEHSLNVNGFLTLLYSNMPHDIIYHGIMAQRINNILDSSRRKHHV